jgi:nucleoside-diphosphate-sugar epimerase
VSGAPRRALVTGATGFIGRHLVRSLLADGIAVQAIVRPGSDVRPLPDGVELIHFDGSTAAALAELLSRSGRPDVVFHLATKFVGVHRTEDVEPLIAANVLLGTQLAEALVTRRPSVVVNVGTAWQHDVDASYRPAALYAATKQAMEDILRYYAESGAFPVTNVKLFDTYGPDDPRGKLLDLLAAAGREGRVLRMSPGEQLIDLLHVHDAVSALRAAAAVRDGWRSFSAGSGHPLPLRELVEVFGTVTGRPVQVEWGARPYRQREMFEPWNAGPPVPGWRPRISLDDGIRSIWCP